MALFYAYPVHLTDDVWELNDSLSSFRGYAALTTGMLGARWNLLQFQNQPQPPVPFLALGEIAVTRELASITCIPWGQESPLPFTTPVLPSLT